MATVQLTRKKINFGYMRFAKILSFFFVLAFIFMSCEKDEIPVAPSIVFVKQSTRQVADSGKGEDFVIFQFDFQDGDADIGPVEVPGEPPPAWQNIQFTDSRNNNTTYYDFPPIPSSVVKEDGIKGTFRVELNPQTLIARTDTPAHTFTDTVWFDVSVFDNEGNLSNTVRTNSIVIVK